MANQEQMATKSQLGVESTYTTQSANETLGTKEKKQYYLIIENAKKKKLTINIGEKTHNAVQALIKEK